MATFKYLLETSTCIELLRGNERVRQHCVEHNQLCCISAITAIELLYGAYDAPEKYRETEIAKAKMLIDYYTVVGIDEIPDAFSRGAKGSGTFAPLSRIYSVKDLLKL